MERDLQFAVVKSHHSALFYILIVLIVLAVIVTVLRLLYYRKLKKAVAAGTMTEEEAATLRKRGWRMWLAEEHTKLQAKRAAAHEAKEAKRAAEAETEAAAAAGASPRPSPRRTRRRTTAPPLTRRLHRLLMKRRAMTPMRLSTPDVFSSLTHNCKARIPDWFSNRGFLYLPETFVVSGQSLCVCNARPPRPFGRSGRQICNRVNLCALPLDALRVSSSTMPSALSSSRMRSASPVLALRAA